MQLALELLTGVCATLPDPEPVADGEVVEDEEEDEDVEWQGAWTCLVVCCEANSGRTDDDGATEERVLEMDVEPETATANGAAPQPPSRLLQLAEPLLALAVPTQLSFPPLPSSTEAAITHPPTTSVLGAIHVRALECLSNIFLNTPHLDAEVARRVWAAVWPILGACGPVQTGPRIPGQERRMEMLDAGMGVLWGLARAARGELVRSRYYRVPRALLTARRSPRKRTSAR